MKIIPKHYQEVEELYKQLQSESARCITLISANGQEGTTSLTFSLAERLVAAHHNVLVIDLNQCQPINLADLGCDEQVEPWCFDDISCQTNVITLPNCSLLTVQGLNNSQDIRNSAIIEEAMLRLRQEYDYILMDMSPALRVNRANLPLHILAKCTDLTLVCVALGKNTEEDVSNTHATLQKAGLTECRFVILQQYLPPLGPQLLTFFNEKLHNFPKLQRYLTNQVQKRAFLFRCP